MGPSFTRDTCTPAQIAQFYWPPSYMGHTHPYNIWGAPAASFGRYCSMCGVLSFSPFVAIISPHTPNTPKPPTSHFSGAIFGKYTFYLCSLAFSLRPDEAASVWRQAKLVFNKFDVLLCFSTQEISYYDNLSFMKPLNRKLWDNPLEKNIQHFPPQLSTHMRPH